MTLESRLLETDLDLIREELRDAATLLSEIDSSIGDRFERNWRTIHQDVKILDHKLDRIMRQFKTFRNRWSEQQA